MERHPQFVEEPVKDVAVLNSNLKGPLAEVGRTGLLLSYKEFLGSQFGAKSAWAWGVFLTVWPGFHDQARAATGPSNTTSTHKPTVEATAETTAVPAEWQ